MRALDSRGFDPRVVTDEPGVMLALAELSDRGASPCVLVIAEPAWFGRLAELVCAVQTHYPEVLCWQYATRGSGAGRLSELDKRVAGPPRLADFAGGPTEARSEGSGGGRGSKSDASVGLVQRRRRPVDGLLTKMRRAQPSPREIVTQQELTMLLGPVPGEAS